MKVRGVAANSALALLGDLAAKGGAAAVMMVAARGLSTAQFALLATATAIATVLTSALDLGSQTLLTRDGISGPGARGGLLRALALARAPLLACALVGALGVGLLTGQLLEALATLLLAGAGAAQLSLTGALRSAQDLRPEAVAKLASGLLMLAAAGACVVIAPRADAMLLALSLASLLALVPMLGAARNAIAGGPSPAPWTALRRAAPLGAMALATLAYYRSGTIALSLFSTSEQTARFAAASTFAYGLLSVANAVTTGLLPRLSAAVDEADRAAVTRRALAWMVGIAVPVAALVALLSGPLLEVLFGSRYRAAAGPLAVLAAATVPIAAAGVLGTALISAGRLRPLAIQVVASLVVNVVALALLVPALGALGASLATLACEVVALLLLGRAAARSLPRLHLRPIPVTPSLTGSPTS